MAEWLCSGLQNRVHRFNSGPGLHRLFVFFYVSYFNYRQAVKKGRGQCVLHSSRNLPLVIKETLFCPALLRIA